VGIESVNEIWEPRTWEIEGDTGVRNYERSWRVRMTAATDDPIAATISGELPIFFTTYKAANGYQDIGATLRRYRVQQQSADPLEYRVTAFYTNARTQQRLSDNPFQYHSSGGNTGAAKETNPLLRAPEVQWGTLRYQRVMYRDRDGEGITASNGQRFEQPIMADRSYLVLNIARNELNYNVESTLNFIDKVNSASWALGGIINTTIASKLAKCEAITAQPQVEQNKFFWKVNYTFHINPAKFNSELYEGWDAFVLDAGTYKKPANPAVGPPEKPTLFPEKWGGTVTGPVPLDGAGDRLDPDDDGNFAYVYKQFRLYESIDFNLLNLPNPL
jgi:hypothetical protein